MRVTGWTEFENQKYIDVGYEAEKLWLAALKNIPKLPTADEVRDMTEEERISCFENQKRLFNEALNTEEIKNANELLNKVTDAVIADLREHGYHFSGIRHQECPYGTPIIDDKYILCLSQRSWGDIMARAFPEEIDNSKGYGYLEWSWFPKDVGKTKIPDKSLWVEAEACGHVL